MRPAAGRTVGAAPEPLTVVEAVFEAEEAELLAAFEAEELALLAALEAEELALLTTELRLLRAELMELSALLTALLAEEPPLVEVPVRVAPLMEVALETTAVVAAPRAMSEVVDATVLVLSMTK